MMRQISQLWPRKMIVRGHIARMLATVPETNAAQIVQLIDRIVAIQEHNVVYQE